MEPRCGDPVAGHSGSVRLPPRGDKAPRSVSPCGDLGYHTLLGTPSWGDTSPVAQQQPQQRNPRRGWCPFDRLPDDLLLRVLGFLASDELCCCARVCRRWYFLAWEPQLWTSVVLASERLPVDHGLRTLFRLLSRDTPGVCSAVERVCLSGCVRLSDGGLTAVARRCPQLRTLEVRGCTQVTDVGVSEVVSRCLNLDRLDLTGCFQVTSVRFRPAVPAGGVALSECPGRGESDSSLSGRGVPRQLYLQYVDLTDCQALEDAGVKALARGCPQLTHLFLRRCLRITDTAVKSVASYCVMLRELSISDCLQVTDFGLYELAKLGPHLRYLSVAKCERVSDAGLKQVCRHCYRLRYLNARGCEAVSDATLEVLARSCPRLRALDVGKCEVGDRGLACLARHCPNLRKLSLKSCDLVTDRGLQALAYFCRGLQQLSLQDCSMVTLDGYRTVRKLCRRCIIEHTNPGFH